MKCKLDKKKKLIYQLLLMTLLLSFAFIGTSLAKYTTEVSDEIDLTIEPEVLSDPTLTLSEDLLIYLNGIEHGSGNTWKNLKGSDYTVENTGGEWTGSSLYLQSSEYAYFPDYIAHTDSFTLETTICLSDQQKYGWILGNWQNGGFGFSIDEEHHIRAWIGHENASGFEGNNSYSALISEEILNSNQTYTLAIVYDKSTKTFSLYINGELDSQLTNISDLLPPTGETRLALNANMSGLQQGGSSLDIDYYTVRFYKCALSEEALANNHAYDKSVCTYTTNGKQNIVTTNSQDVVLSGVEIEENAFVFDGENDYLKFSGNNGYFSESGFTMECTFSVKSLEDNLGDDGNCLGCNYQSGGYGIEIVENYPQVRAWIGERYQIARSSTQIEPGKKYTITGTYSALSGKLCLYVNGNCVASKEVSGELTPAQTTGEQPFLIGNNPNGQFTNSGGLDSNYGFKGNIYSFTIYDKCLSDAQIKDNFDYLNSNGANLYLCATGTLVAYASDINKLGELQFSTDTSNWVTTSDGVVHAGNIGELSVYGKVVSKRGTQSPKVQSQAFTEPIIPRIISN